jgi:hypothetical protein
MDHFICTLHLAKFFQQSAWATPLWSLRFIHSAKTTSQIRNAAHPAKQDCLVQFLRLKIPLLKHFQRQIREKEFQTHFKFSHVRSSSGLCRFLSSWKDFKIKYMTDEASLPWHCTLHRHEMQGWGGSKARPRSTPSPPPAAYPW